MHQLWNGIFRNYKDRFWWYLTDIFKRLQNRACMFSFHLGWLFEVSSFKPDTENNMNFDIVPSKRAKFFDHVEFFKIIYQILCIIFGIHNLQMFKHNTLINEVQTMQFQLLNIRPNCITCSDKKKALLSQGNHAMQHVFPTPMTLWLLFASAYERSRLALAVICRLKADWMWN